MKSLLFTLYLLFICPSLHAEQSVGDIQISRLDYTPIRISIITEFSSNKIVTSPITKTLFRDSYAFQLLDAKDIMLALEVNRSDKAIMETKVWQSSDFHKIALILKNANIDIILVPGKKGKSWTLFYLANKSLRKMDVAQLKKPNPNEREFRSALSKTLGYQAFVVKAKGKNVVAALIYQDSELGKQGLILKKSDKILAVSSAVSGTHLLSLSKKTGDIGIFKSIIDGNQKIALGSKILLKD